MVNAGQTDLRRRSKPRLASAAPNSAREAGSGTVVGGASSTSSAPLFAVATSGGVVQPLSQKATTYEPNGSPVTTLKRGDCGDGGFAPITTVPKSAVNTSNPLAPASR